MDSCRRNVKCFLINIFILTAASLTASCAPQDENVSGTGKQPQDEHLVSVVYHPGENGVFIYRIPSIVRTNAGTLLAFAEARWDSIEDQSDVDIVLRRSVDNGKTWGEMQFLKDNGTDVASLPSPVVLPDGKIILLYTLLPVADKRDKQMFMITSDDDGLTWSEEVEITDQILDPKSQNGYASCPVHGLVKQYEPNKGRIIMPARVNVSVGEGTWTSPRAAHIIYSDDNGKTWHQGGYMDHPWGSECTVTELCNGDLLLNTRDSDDEAYYRYQAYSTDGGYTFEHSEKTDLVEPAKGCHGSLLTYGPASESGDESIVLFSNPSHSLRRQRGSVKASFDSGKSWSKMFLYTSETGSSMYAAYSDMVLLEDGKIGVFYERGKNYGEGLVFLTLDLSDIKDDYTYTIAQAQ